MKDYKVLTYRHHFPQKSTHRTTANAKCLFPIIFLLIFIMVLMLSSRLAISNEPLKTKEVIVSRGDTLWSIAENYSSTNGDIREYIYHIKKFNNLKTAQIYPGQVILLPLE